MNKLMVIIFLSWISLSWAANHYVDKNANGNNNGASWSNAWESFSDIDWSQIQPGDILFISGGTDSTVYNEQLTVGASGTPNQDIIVRGGWDAGHNGKAIIDRNYASGFGVHIRNRQYVTISNIYFRECVVAVYVQGSVISSATTGINDITLDSLDIRNWGGDGGGMGILFDGWNSATGLNIDSLTITNCTLILIDSTAGATDGIAGKMMHNLYIDNCYIYIDNGGPYISTAEPGHSDCIQWYFGMYDIKVTNNVLINMGGRDTVLYTAYNTLHSQVIMSEQSYGDIIIYNNILSYPYGYGLCNNFFDKESNVDEHWIIVHNTFITKSSMSLANIRGSDIISKNNIFYAVEFPNSGTQFTTGNYNATIEYYPTPQIGIK